MPAAAAAPSTDSLAAVTEAQDAQCAWLVSLAAHNQKKNPKVASDLRAAAQNLRFNLTRVKKIIDASVEANKVAANAAAAAAQKALDDLKATFPPANLVMDAEDDAALGGLAVAAGVDPLTGEKPPAAPAQQTAPEQQAPPAQQ